MTQSCFLCTPNQHLVYLDDGAFFAMLGFGPIVEGYSLLATKDHAPSMLDLSLKDVQRLCKFTQLVRQRLRPHYGEVIMTEHGRVPPCTLLDNSGREKHCFHAHRLLFPVSADLANTLKGHDLQIKEYPSFVDARLRFDGQGEYLYYERPDGSCLVVAAPRRLVRQFFRYKVAEYVGHPEFASWRLHPRPEVVEAARTILMSTGDRNVLDHRSHNAAAG